VTVTRGRQVAGFIGRREVAGSGRATTVSLRARGRALAN
jgi:hypothetical protein